MSDADIAQLGLSIAYQQAEAGAAAMDRMAQASLRLEKASESAALATANGARAQRDSAQSLLNEIANSRTAVAIKQELEKARIAENRSARDAALARGRLTQLSEAALSLDKQLVQQTGALTVAQDKYNASLRSAAQATIQARTAAGASASASNAAISSRLGVVTNFGADARGSDITAYGERLDALRAKYNPIFAAGRQYKSTLDEINMAVRTGALREQEAAVAIDRTKKTFAAQVVQLRAYGNAMDVAGRRNGAFGGSLGQLSFQINDIVTMALMGANPMQILATQGGQIFQVWQMNRNIFGEVGALLLKYGPILAGVAVAAGAGAFAWSQWNREQRLAEKAADSVTASLKSSTAYLDDNTRALVRNYEAKRKSGVEDAKKAVADAQASFSAKSSYLRSLTKGSVSDERGMNISNSAWAINGASQETKNAAKAAGDAHWMLRQAQETLAAMQGSPTGSQRAALDAVDTLLPKEKQIADIEEKITLLRSQGSAWLKEHPKALAAIAAGEKQIAEIRAGKHSGGLSPDVLIAREITELKKEGDAYTHIGDARLVAQKQNEIERAAIERMIQGNANLTEAQKRRIIETTHLTETQKSEIATLVYHNEELRRAATLWESIVKPANDYAQDLESIAVALARHDISPRQAKIANDNLAMNQSWRSQAIDLGNSNPFGAMAGIGADAQKANAGLGHDKSNEFVDQAEQAGIISAQTAADAKLQIEQDYHDKVLQLDADLNDRRMALGESTFGALADGVGAMLGKQSAAYKAVFAIEKAFAIARATMALQVAIAEASATPWPANIPAIAQAITLGASIMSNIASIASPQGYAMGRIGRTGGAATDTELAWLDPRESVINPAGTQRNPNTLAAINAGANYDNAANSNRPSIRLEVVHDGSTAIRYERVSDDHIRVIAENAVQDKAPGIVASDMTTPYGKTAKANKQTTKAQRKLA